MSQRAYELRNVFRTCGVMEADPVSNYLKANVQPYTVIVNTPSTIFPIRKKVEELRRLQRENVIVPMEDSSEWCAPIVPVIKKNDEVRIAVDYKHLTTAVKRQQHMLPNPESLAPKLAGAAMFSSECCWGLLPNSTR